MAYREIDTVMMLLYGTQSGGLYAWHGLSVKVSRCCGMAVVGSHGRLQYRKTQQLPSGGGFDRPRHTVLTAAFFSTQSGGKIHVSERCRNHFSEEFVSKSRTRTFGRDLPRAPEDQTFQYRYTGSSFVE